jgi:hypothetical protein
MSDADEITEGMWLSDQLDGADERPSDYEPAPKHSAYERPFASLARREKAKVVQAQKQAEAKNSGRWRCLSAGCNPPLTEATAREHSGATGHRVAKWPVRSVEGTRRAKARNRTGYYDSYNASK